MGFTISKKDLKTFKGFMNLDGKKVLLYHNDPDGISSATLLLKFFPDMESIPKPGPRMDDEFLEEMIKKKPKLVIFADMSGDQEWEKIKVLQKAGCKTMIIDHHIYEKNLNSKDILHINPRFKEKGAYIPTAYMIYKILEDSGFDVKEHCWIAAMGVIGDYGFQDCKDFLDMCRKEYPYLLREHPLESKLGKGADLITYAVIMKGLRGAGESLKILMDSMDYGEFANNEKLQRWGEEMEREFEFIIKDAEREECPDKDIIIFKIKSRFNISSAVATHFGEKYPGKIVVVRKDKNGGVKLCFRNQNGRVNLGDVVKKCTSGIGSGGGHEKAAGAFVTDWEKFKKRFIASVSKS